MDPNLSRTNNSQPEPASEAEMEPGNDSVKSNSATTSGLGSGRAGPEFSATCSSPFRDLKQGDGDPTLCAPVLGRDQDWCPAVRTDWADDGAARIAADTSSTRGNEAAGKMVVGRATSALIDKVSAEPIATYDFDESAEYSDDSNRGIYSPKGHALSSASRSFLNRCHFLWLHHLRS